MNVKNLVITVLPILLVLCSAEWLLAQQKYTISGYVKEAATGESMLAVNVVVKELNQGTTSNEFGFYSLNLPEGNYTLEFSFLGFERTTKQVALKENTRLNVELNDAAIMKDEVVISGERQDKNVESTEISTVELSMKSVKSIPALFGEVDVLKAIQFLPGVQSAGEGSSGFYVRGGGPDQNLILLDQAVVYNTGHLFGFFSVFNSDALKNVKLIKGGMPARYGGRLSSVVDITMKDGNSKEYQVEGGIGVIASRLTVQGPIVKDKASFIVSGRRTYLEAFYPILDKIKGGDFSGNKYFFYDLNAKVNYKVSDKDRFYLSAYFGKDVFNYDSGDGFFDINIPWGNRTATFRWNHLFNSKLFMNLSAIYNDYRFEVSSGFKDVRFDLFSGIRDLSAKMDFDYSPNPNHSVKFGVLYTHHVFTPYSATGFAGEAQFQTDSLSQKYAHEVAAYLEDDISLHSRFKVNIGLRASMFTLVGPLNRTYYNNETGEILDQRFYTKGENIAQHWGLEPRMSFRFTVDDHSSLKGGFTMNNQYIHLVTSATSTLPTDLWVPSTDIVKPQIGFQYSLGYFRNFLNDLLETSVELYYKDMRNQIEYGESYVPTLNTDIEDAFVFGRGYSTGAEFFVKKTRGDFNGWLGYTLSWTWREFPDINEGERFPATFDRRHDLSVVASYKINEKWSLGATFVYGTGQATTVPVGRYFIEGQVVNEYGDRNAYRMPAYHRADISATYIIPREKYYSDLTISIYNVYSRRNPYFIYYDVEGSIEDQNLEIQAKQVSLFPILPSLTWNFKF
ncbi:MAG: TonB-dependent receptor [Chitinophagales bacterium]